MRLANDSDSTWISTNTAGNQSGFWGYDAYGNLAFGTPTSLFGYSGQYTDATTGLVNDRARWYQSQSGSFITRDPKFALTDTAYTYVANDPVNRSDPTGADNPCQEGAASCPISDRGPTCWGASDQCPNEPPPPLPVGGAASPGGRTPIDLDPYGDDVIFMRTSPLPDPHDPGPQEATFTIVFKSYLAQVVPKADYFEVWSNTSGYIDGGSIPVRFGGPRGPFATEIRFGQPVVIEVLVEQYSPRRVLGIRTFSLDEGVGTQPSGGIEGVSYISGGGAVCNNERTTLPSSAGILA
jgi:RHS repeat-associated protein